jgi:hypothetical protein
VSNELIRSELCSCFVVLRENLVPISSLNYPVVRDTTVSVTSEREKKKMSARSIACLKEVFVEAFESENRLGFAREM